MKYIYCNINIQLLQLSDCCFPNTFFIIIYCVKISEIHRLFLLPNSKLISMCNFSIIM